MFSQFLQLTLAGVAQGCVYALVALGFVLIYKATETVNFAQGDLMMLGAFFGLTASTILGWPYWATILFAIVVMALVGMLIERIVIRPVLGYPTFTVVMITIGVGYVLRGVVTMVPGWGTETHSLKTPFGDQVIRFGGAVLAVEQIATIGVHGGALSRALSLLPLRQARRRHAGDLAEPARRLLHGHPGAAREHADLGTGGGGRGVRRHPAGAESPSCIPTWASSG